MRIQDFSNTAEFLATMSRDQLKEYAQNNAGNPYLVSLALFVSDQQKAIDRSRQAKAQPQASVVDSAIENIAPMARATIPAEEVEFDMPEDTGIGQIPIDDTYYGANGGIIAFADGDLITDPQFGGSIAQMEDDRPQAPKPTREQVNAIVQALRDNKQNVGLSTIRDIEEGKITAPTKSPVAAPQVVDLPPEVGVGSVRAPASTSVAPSAAPRGAAMPSLKPLGIQGLFDEAMGKVAVTESPLQSQFEKIARMKKELAQAETAGAEEIQKKFGDITKGQRARQDAKEKEIAAMDNQGIGIGLLLYGAELMSKRNPDASVGVKGYLANRDRVAAARDKLSESRDRLEAAEAQRGELNATQLHKLRMNERKVGIEATEEIVKDIKERLNVDRDMALKILDLQIKDAIALRGEARADRRAEVKDKSPEQLSFNQILAEKGGNAVEARKEYQRQFPSTDFATLGRKAGLEAAYKALTELTASPAPPAIKDPQIAALQKQIQTLSGAAAPAAAGPSAAAIAALKANPNLAAEFDKKFNGTSAQYLR